MAAPIRISYDSRGNVTHNSHFSMTYNLANQMTTANGTSYLYDGHNRRVRINSNEFNVYSKEGKLLLRKDGSGETQYVYLGNQLVGKRTGSSVKYVHTDMLGSSTVETNTNKSLAGTRKYYRAYGETIGTAQDDVGYTGHLFDSETGLNYMQARYYDPIIGRFMSNDPVDALKHLSTPNGIHGFNRYAYANNNPYKYTDPTGESSKAITLPKTPSGRTFVYPKSSHAHASGRHATGQRSTGTSNQFKSNLMMSSYEVASTVVSAVVSAGDEYYQPDRDSTAFTFESEVPIGQDGETSVTVTTKTLSSLSDPTKISEVETMLAEAGVEGVNPRKVEVVITVAPDAGNMIDENRVKQ